MAGKKLSELTGDKRATTLEPTDLVLITRDPDGTDTSMSLTGEDLAAAIAAQVPAPPDTAAEIASTPAGNLSSANVQDALNELDTEKAPTAHTHAESDVTGLTADLAGKQPSSAKLTSIAGLDDTQTGVIATDGSGWIRKTYAALKTALGLTKADVGLGNVDNTSDANKPVSTAQQTALNLKQDTSAKGQANGYASLDGTGKVPATQLPAYVDDVLEYANLAAFPATGSTGLIYVADDTNKTYRWGGSSYIEISPSPGSTDAVAEGVTNLYYTNTRAAAAAPVQSVAGKTGAVVLAKSDVGLSNVDNTSDMNKPVSTAQAAADATKVSKSGDTITGNLTVQDAATPTKAYRFRTSGGSLDFEVGGTDIHISTWEHPDFTGAQYDQIVFKADDSDMAFQRQADMNGHKFVNVADPTGAQDVSTKAYVDSHNKRLLRVVIDGGGSAVTTGAKKVYVTVPFSGTITKWRLQADQTGSAVLDIWKDAFANTPPTVADTITAAAKPTLSSAQAAESSTLTGWTTAVTAGDVIEVNVDSASTVQRLILDLFIAETF